MIDLKVEVFDKTSENDGYGYGYNEELNMLRNKIDNINYETWKTVRWIINDYDFVVKSPIINRAFYKYWEIVNHFSLKNFDSSTDLAIHLAEAPGGFIQVSQKIFTKKNKKKVIKDEDGYNSIVKEKYNNKFIYSMSLNKDIEEYKKYNLPSYNQNVINNKVVISYGEDNTGNLLNLNNIYFLKNIIEKEKKNIKIITADGGFDEGNDFNNKEQLHYSLILHEILAMLILSFDSKETNFILKMYDTYTKTSIDMLYLLHLIFENVHIFKPLTSRPTNSEKYVICKNMKISNIEKIFIIDNLKPLSDIIKTKKDASYYFVLFKNLPNTFCEYIKKINEKVINQQCLNLRKALYFSNLSKEELKLYLEENKVELKNKKDKAFKEWCKKYNLII